MALFEGLMVFNAKTGKAELGLAESCKISKDGTVYTFKLRKASWSDGTPITAKDFVESWLRTLDPATASNYASMPADMIAGAKDYNSGKGKREDVKIRAVDAQTFEFTTVGPMPYVIDMPSRTTPLPSCPCTPSRSSARTGSSPPTSSATAPSS